MMKLVVLFAVLACAYGTQKPTIGFGSFTKIHPKFGPKVVGGEPAELGAFPYQTSLQLKGGLAGGHSGEFPYQVSLQLIGGLAGGHYCGGSLISPSTVLTAGHCVTEVNIGVFQHIEAFVGLVELSKPGDSVQSSRVTKTVVNPDFAGGVAPNDLALHILATPFVLGGNTALLSLPTAQMDPTGIVTLSGWGSTSHTQMPQMPDRLQSIELPIVPYGECKDALDAIETGSPFVESMVCTGPLTGGFGACSGDSGGPLVSGSGANRTLVGIVSWGFIPCGGQGAPSVFTNPSYFLDFINENTV